MLFTNIYKFLTNIWPNNKNTRQLGLISVLFGLALYTFLFFAIFGFKDEYYYLKNIDIYVIPGLLYIFMFCILVDYTTLVQPFLRLSKGVKKSQTCTINK